MRKENGQGEIVPQDDALPNVSQEMHRKTGSQKLHHHKRHFFLMLPFIVMLVLSLIWMCSVPQIASKPGAFAGSWRYVTSGTAEATEEGTEVGLSAKDTVARIDTKMTMTGNLEVLLVDFHLTDKYTHGKYYAALFGLKGEGIFSVNLEQSQTDYNKEKNQITITIPEPVFIPYLDDGSLERLAEYKSSVFDGSSENGYEGYLNTREQVEQHVQEKLYGFDIMQKQARTSALRQVEMLASSVCGNSFSVKVQFPNEEE